VIPDPVELLRELIRFDTTNPPGNEEPCVAHVERLLNEAGIETTRYEKEPGRPNLVARLPGGGDPPLVLYGHVDVVTTANQQWTHAPFAGDLADGFVWGRGALDMKGGVAMMVTAFLRAHAEGRGGLVLVILSDEENGGTFGAQYLADEHPEAFGGARHAIGEFGGAAIHISGRRFYPIQVAEKERCWLRAEIKGPGGHGAMPIRGGAMARLGRLLTALDRKRLPIHVTPVAEAFLSGLADELPRAQATVLRRLLDPRTADLALPLLGARRRALEPMLRNTVSPTIVHGGEKINVIPSELELQLDGRILPGQTPDDLIVELAQLAHVEVAYEVIQHEPGPPDPDMSWFDTLAGVLRELDPEGIPVPLLQVGVTDARYLARAGIQTYGFLPLNLPEGFDYTSLIHAADERVPADALRFGAEAVWRAVERYPAGSIAAR
jgi:acetylornithine deacetylase/succinyl-diaminopimelate desuccinylase-like protein